MQKGGKVDYLLHSSPKRCKLVLIMEKLSLKHLRASLGLTQKQLAEAAKISEKAVLDIETKKARPRLITAYAIIKAINLKLIEEGREEVTVESLDWQPL